MFSIRKICILILFVDSLFASSLQAEHHLIPDKPSKITLQLRWMPQFQFAGYYAAFSKGFYKQAGLEVEIVSGDPKHQPVAEVLSGRAVYGVGNSEVLLNRLKGQPLVALAAVFQHSASVLLTPKQAHIHTLEDLAGKKVMLMNRDEDADFISMFAKRHLALSQMDVLPSSYDISDLSSGKVDALNSYLTNEPFFLQQQGFEYDVIMPVHYGIDFYSDILFTTEEELANYPERVIAMRQASMKGWRYAFDHPDEIIDLLINHYQVNKSRAHLEFEMNEMRKLVFPDLIELGMMNAHRWQGMAQTFVDAKLVNSTQNLDGFIFETEPENLPKWVLHSLYWGAGILLLLFAIVTYVLRVNRRLNLAKQAVQEKDAILGFINDSTNAAIFMAEGSKIIFANPALQWLTGYSQAELLQKEFIGLFENHTLVQSVVQKDPSEMQIRSKYGQSIWVECRISLINFQGKSRLVVSLFNITERKYRENKAMLRSTVMHMLSADKPLSEILQTIVNSIESLDRQLTCVVLLMNGEKQQLFHGASTEKMPMALVKLLDGLSVGLGVGTCGEAAFSGKRVLVEDISEHPNWKKFKNTALDAGLRSCWSQPVLSGSGEVLATFGIYHQTPYLPDKEELGMVSEYSQLTAIAIEQTAKNTQLKLAANVFKFAQEGIVLTSETAKIIDANDKFCEMTGYERAEIIGKNPKIFSSGRQPKSYYQQMWQALDSQGAWQGEMWNRRKDGEFYAQNMTISRVTDEFGQAIQYVGICSDVTQTKRYQERLEHIAYYDALTSLPNRVLLADRLARAIVRAERYTKQIAIVYIDLDGFKAVNDQFGHEKGDVLLNIVSKKMIQVIREEDTLARIGGDEFVAILSDLEAKDACYRVLARLLEAASSEVIMGENTVKVSASIGVAMYPNDALEPDMLMRYADQAMYHAKGLGKNRYEFFDDLNKTQ